MMTVLKLDLAAEPGQAREKALGIERKADLVTLAYNLRPGAREPRFLSEFDMGGHREIEYRAALFMVGMGLWKAGNPS